MAEPPEGPPRKESAAGEASAQGGPEQHRQIDDFLGAPTRDLTRWRWLWEGDHPFPIRSHRGPLGKLLVLAKRLLRPFVKVPANDLWERQRIFNLILLEWLQGRDNQRLPERLGALEASLPERLGELLAHNDALFARLDQKLDLYRRQADELSSRLGAALAVVAEQEAVGRGGDGEPTPTPVAALATAVGEQAYVELERRFRGTPEEIRERLIHYLPHLEGRGPILDLGCGRGEALALFAEHGLVARGVDGSASMVARCRERGLEVEEGDLFRALADAGPESLGAVVSFHVIEHLPPEAVEHLVRLAFRALRPGGLLILETPNPLSLVVAARLFWIDPTHRRPVHPETLQLACRLAGFDPVEFLPLRPFPAARRLPEIDLATLPAEHRALAHDIHLLRDHLDDLLYGEQDYAVLAEKLPASSGA